MIKRLQALTIVLVGIHPAFAGGDPAEPATPISKLLGPGTIVLQHGPNSYDELGKDIRGRVYSNDFDEFLVGKPGNNVGSTEVPQDLLKQIQSLGAYWNAGPLVVTNRALWKSFLLLNHLPENTSHGADVLAAESALQDLVDKGGPPTSEWTARSRALNTLYVAERRKIATAASPTAWASDYRPRTSVCPASAGHTSGSPLPKLSSTPHALQEFYPPELLRRGVEGYVILSLKISASGCVTERAVAESSGSVELDAAALSWVDTASFMPGENDGKPVEGTTRLAVAFKLG